MWWVLVLGRSWLPCFSPVVLALIALVEIHSATTSAAFTEVTCEVETTKELSLIQTWSMSDPLVEETKCRSGDPVWFKQSR